MCSHWWDQSIKDDITQHKLSKDHFACYGERRPQGRKSVSRETSYLNIFLVYIFSSSPPALPPIPHVLKERTVKIQFSKTEKHLSCKYRIMCQTFISSLMFLKMNKANNKKKEYQNQVARLDAQHANVPRGNQIIIFGIIFSSREKSTH